MLGKEKHRSLSGCKGEITKVDEPSRGYRYGIMQVSEGKDEEQKKNANH
jgi:hypothetical protein